MDTNVSGLIYIARGSGFQEADEGCLAIMELWLPGKGDTLLTGTIEKDDAGGFYFEPDTDGAHAMKIDFSDELEADD